MDVERFEARVKDEKPEDLRLRTKKFALDVIRLYATLPKSIDAQVLGRQVLRSGTSVGANYREAYRSRSKVEFIAKIGDCLKELEESSYWFELLAESGIMLYAKAESKAIEGSLGSRIRSPSWGKYGEVSFFCFITR